MTEAIFTEFALRTGADTAPAPVLDPKTEALVRLAALISSGASFASYRSSVEAALGAGGTADEVVGTLIAVAPIVGLARLVRGAPLVGLAVGYDVDAALERLDMPLDRPWPGTDLESSGPSNT
jgi:alkylhydroperoxidase/carboxymuconolactone decarboxylase family protein YurZ